MRISASCRCLFASISILVVLIFAIRWWALEAKVAARKRTEQECRRLRDSKQWQQLADVAQRWSEWDPLQASAWLYRAEASEHDRDAVKTAEYLSHVPETDPRAVVALGALVSLQFEVLNQPLQGVLNCQRILRIDPRVTSAHRQLIFFLLSTLQRPEMIRRIREAIELRRESPESYVFLAGADWIYPSNLYSLNTHWLESEPDSELFQVGRAMQVYNSNAKSHPERSKDFEQIPTADQLLLSFPHNLEILAYHLENQMANGQADAVQSLVDAAPEGMTEDARFWIAKAWLQDQRGETQQAETSLKRALAIDPYWWKVHFQLLDLYRRQDKAEDAAKFHAIYQNSKKLAKLIADLQDGTAAGPEFYKLLLSVADSLKDTTVSNALRHRNLAQ